LWHETLHGKKLNTSSDLRRIIPMNKDYQLRRRTLTPRRTAWFVAALIAIAPATLVQGDVTHLYTFNGNADDTGTVGTADGTLTNGATVSVGGQAVLDGVDDFVNLPGAAIGINAYANATFEGWFTINAQPAWQRLFDFGNTNAANQGENYIFYSPTSGGNDSRAAITNGGGGAENQANAGPILPTGTQHHIAVVVDQTALQMSVYHNGVLATGAQNPVTLTQNLAGVSTNFAYIGKSVWPDPTLNGFVDEFRVHNTALTAAQVLASFNAGPAPSNTLALTVNTSTGNVQLRNVSSSSLTFDYYDIASAGGKLRPAAGFWNSLDDQNIDLIGPSSAESWAESGGSSANVLAELFLDGSSTLAPGSSFNLGNAFNTGLGAGDLKFRFTLTTGELINGAVNYVAGNADFNGDTRVNGSDFLIWQRFVGTTSGATLAQGDADGNGAVNAADLNIWKSSYGTGGAAAATAGVPEPASAGLAAWCAALALVWRRRIDSRSCA
jgi:hypothetical protein